MDLDAVLKAKIREVQDFPKPGINFKDITPLLSDPVTLGYAISKIKEYFSTKRINVVASAESRGFIFGAILAHELGVSFVPIRKPGKLPWRTIKEEFELEYGKDAFEIHEDSIKSGDNVLLVDDVLATGGTMSAAVRLIERLNGNVAGIAFLVELSYLKGGEKIKGYDVFSLIDYK